MFSRSLLAACLVAAVGGLAVALRPHAADDKPAAPARVSRGTPTLPGLQPAGDVLLPNGWSLRPAGTLLPLGDFPVNLSLHPSGNWLAALHAGYGPHEDVVVDLTSGKERVTTR